MRLQIPTTNENLEARLLVRYAVFYLLSLGVGIFLATRAPVSPIPHDAALLSTLTVPCALAAPLLTVASLYLLALSLGKGLLDGIILTKAVRLVLAGSIGILPFNACFLLTAFSLVLFLMTSTKACRFAFSHTARDTKLILSPDFARYLLEATLLGAISSTIYFLWLRLLPLLGGA